MEARTLLAAAGLAALCIPVPPLLAQQQRAATYAGGAARDVSPPKAFASDEWVRTGKTPWTEEARRRQDDLQAYLQDADTARARHYGFFRDGAPMNNPPFTPALAWNWFSEHPIGYGGVPNVLLQTVLSLDPGTETDPDLKKLAGIWKKESVIPSERGQGKYTLDHLGFGPRPADYAAGIAKAPGERSPLPNGFVFDPDVKAEDVALVNLRLRILRRIPLIELLAGKLRKRARDEMLMEHPDTTSYQVAPKVDAVFFSCSACHQGRVIVGGRLDPAGRIVERGRMHFTPGMPNTEIEAQYYSQLLMETGLALLDAKSTFSVDWTGGIPSRASMKEAIIPNTRIIKKLYRRMLDRAVDDAVVKTIYGPQPEQVKRARLQTYHVAKLFPGYVGDLIGTAVVTQYVYRQVAAGSSYGQVAGRNVPDVFTNRIGQMDAFGIASGLVAVHAQRPDNGFVTFLCRDSEGRSPIFQVLGTNPGASCDSDSLKKVSATIVKTVGSWAPQVPAPVDIPSLNWTGHRKLANWDGNQGASARTLASGTSATGHPQKVNVRVHEPLNPLINNMPPAPYPFAIDRAKARRGMALFNSSTVHCAECHRPNSDEVIPIDHLGVDPNRALVTSDVSRYALAGLVMESCRIFIRKTGNEWCLPHDSAGKVVRDWAVANDDYFKDTPGRVRADSAGYKVDMLHGVWARAPYLHNGSIPTLGQLLCPAARPKTFLRGNLFYDEALVGFEWAVMPAERYSPFETQQVKTYDTGFLGRSNAGHAFARDLCPDLRGLDPVADRREITRRIVNSKAGDLLEYLKTM